MPAVSTLLVGKGTWAPGPLRDRSPGLHWAAPLGVAGDLAVPLGVAGTSVEALGVTGALAKPLGVTGDFADPLGVIGASEVSIVDLSRELAAGPREDREVGVGDGRGLLVSVSARSVPEPKPERRGEAILVGEARGDLGAARRSRAFSRFPLLTACRGDAGFFSVFGDRASPYGREGALRRSNTFGLALTVGEVLPLRAFLVKLCGYLGESGLDMLSKELGCSKLGTFRLGGVFATLGDSTSPSSSFPERERCSRGTSVGVAGGAALTGTEGFESFSGV